MQTRHQKWHWGVAYLLATSGLILPLSVVYFDVSRIEGSSMLPTVSGDALGFFMPTSPQQISRGDLVSFQTDQRRQIKRVVGLPGEHVLFANGNVYLADPATRSIVRLLDSGITTGRTYRFPGSFDGRSTRFKVPEDGLFVLADHRSSGQDSRVYQADGGLSRPYVSLSEARLRLIGLLSHRGIEFVSRSPIPVQVGPIGMGSFCTTPLPCPENHGTLVP